MSVSAAGNGQFGSTEAGCPQRSWITLDAEAQVIYEIHRRIANPEWEQLEAWSEP